MNRTPSGLPEDRAQFDPSKYFKVIHRESSIKDDNVNDRIQREGCDCWGGSGESEWYANHKGYSNNLEDIQGLDSLNIDQLEDLVRREE